MSKWKGWSIDMKIAEQYCKQQGFDLVPSDAEYQIAKIKTDGVYLVIYPHKTTAMNKHLRIRDEHSKDKHKAQAIQRALNRLAGANCTFQCKWSFIK